jgi:hypothetical protein
VTVFWLVHNSDPLDREVFAGRTPKEAWSKAVEEIQWGHVDFSPHAHRNAIRRLHTRGWRCDRIEINDKETKDG